MSVEELIREHMDIPKKAARKWNRIGSLEQEDLIAEGALALVKSAQSYDPSKGMTFKSWAWFKVRHHLTHIVRTHIRKEKRTLTGEYARFNSLQTEDEEGDPLYQLADPNADVVDLVVARTQLDALKHFPRKEAEVLLRTAAGETSIEIAETWGCSEANVWKYLRMARARMKYANDL